MDTDVLIVGAGPTGLALALSLQRLGIPFVIIDQSPQSATHSRAIAVQARTLELYDQYGLGGHVERAGQVLTTSAVWTGGVRRASLPFGAFGAGLSPHPYVVMYPQDSHEVWLASQLATTVARGAGLAHFTQGDDGVDAVLANGRRIRAQYIAGCDGAHSTVRSILGTGFAGGTYDDLFFVADVDVDAEASTDGFSFFMQASGFVLALALPEARRYRLIGIVPRGLDAASVTFRDVAPGIARDTPLQVGAVHWFSTYRVHHRVAAQFRQGRAFLLGDAAHVHSPAGGQGMNTGIGDAFNLGWKLAQVLRGGPDVLLDSYDSERRAFARVLVATTDALFRRVSGHGLQARMFRQVFFPHVLPMLLRFSRFRHQAFRTVSQLGVQYHASALSQGHAGAIAAGDRLPWCGDNFGALQSCAWQVHVHGAAHPDLAGYCRQLQLALHVFEWNAQARDAGYAMGGIYLVRPDGHVGFAGTDTTALREYCEKWRI